MEDEGTGQRRPVLVQPLSRDGEDAPATARGADGTCFTLARGGLTQTRSTPGPGLQPVVPWSFCLRVELLSEAVLLPGA